MKQQTIDDLYDLFDCFFHLAPRKELRTLKDFNKKLTAAIKAGYPINYWTTDKEKCPYRDYRSGPLLHQILACNPSDISAFLGCYKEEIQFVEEDTRLFDLVKFLLDNGADVNIKDSEGWNALGHLCYNLVGFNWPEDLFKRIVDATEDINYQFPLYASSEKMTAFQLAVERYCFLCGDKRHTNCWRNIKILIDARATPDLTLLKRVFFEIKNNEDVNFRDEKNQFLKSYPEIIKLLDNFLEHKKQFDYSNDTMNIDTWSYEL